MANRYTHVAMGNMADALSHLPDISAGIDKEKSSAATGTNGGHFSQND